MLPDPAHTPYFLIPNLLLLDNVPSVLRVLDINLPPPKRRRIHLNCFVLIGCWKATSSLSLLHALISYQCGQNLRGDLRDAQLCRQVLQT